MTHLNDVTISGTTDGAGAADVTSTQVIHGWIEAFAYDASGHAATLDTTLSVVSVRPDGVDQTIEVLTDTNTSAMHYPRVQADDPAGAAIANVYGRHYVHGTPRVVLAQGALSTAFSLTVFYEPAS